MIAVQEVRSHFFSCRPAGSGFLLQAEGARLSDEERAGSLGNHPAEPALDGQEPGVAAAAPIAPSRRRSIQRRLHYLRAVVSLLAGQSTSPEAVKAVLYLAGRGVGWSEVGPASCIY